MYRYSEHACWKGELCSGVFPSKQSRELEGLRGGGKAPGHAEDLAGMSECPPSAPWSRNHGVAVLGQRAVVFIYSFVL